MYCEYQKEEYSSRRFCMTLKFQQDAEKYAGNNNIMLINSLFGDNDGPIGDYLGFSGLNIITPGL